MCGGIWNTPFGYNHPYINEKITKQLERLPFCNLITHAADAVLDLLEDYETYEVAEKGLLFLALILSMNGVIVMGLAYAGIASVGVGVYNFIPFVKLDGYWILSAVSGVENLMEKSVLTAYTALFRRKHLADIPVSSAKKGFLAVYGVIAFVFSEVFWFSTLLTLRNYFSAWVFVYYPIAAFILAMVTFDFLWTIRHYHVLKRITGDFFG